MRTGQVVKKGNEWIGTIGDAEVARAERKADAVRATADAARQAPEPVSIKIKKLNGQIQEERTYPRSADPRRSAG